MFIGQYRYSVDAKGRLVIPLDYRRQMGSTVVVNKGFENCITVYTMEGWDAFTKETTSLSDYSQDNRNYKRYIMASAFAKELDTQGRISLDKTLIDFAQIDKEVVIIGAGSVIEIWSAENWAKVDENRNDSLIGIGNKISERKLKNE